MKSAVMKVAGSVSNSQFIYILNPWYDNNAIDFTWFFTLQEIFDVYLPVGITMSNDAKIWGFTGESFL